MRVGRGGDEEKRIFLNVSVPVYIKLELYVQYYIFAKCGSPLGSFLKNEMLILPQDFSC